MVNMDWVLLQTTMKHSRPRTSACYYHWEVFWEWSQSTSRAVCSSVRVGWRPRIGHESPI